MPKLLTKTLLRKAADTIGSPGLGGERYMCFAVAAASKNYDAAYRAFGALLQTHGVDTNGRLAHKWRRYDNGNDWTAESQALRFDFLNLLAESL